MNNGLPNSQNFKWITDPVSDIIASISGSKDCIGYCSVMACNRFCTEFCVILIQPPN